MSPSRYGHSERDRNGGVTLKAFVVGALCSFCIAIGEPYGVLVVQGSPLCSDFSTGGAVFLFFVLVLLVNVMLKGIRPRLGLSGQELIVVYIMMIVACTIPSWGFTMNLLPLVTGFLYYATPENEWGDLILPQVRDWLSPTEKEVIWKFFEGGARGEPVPWMAWLWPLIAWGLFIFVIYFIMICLMVILRKQWVEHEKLLFPLTVLPAEMVREEEGALIPPFFKSKIMWTGFAIVCLINTLNALHAYYPYLPRIVLRWDFWALSRSTYFRCATRFEVIGLSYLLNLDVALGLWVFPVLAILTKGMLNRFGWSIGIIQPFSDPAPPSVAHVGLGALIALVIGGFWTARPHLRDVFSKAFGRNRTVDDGDEVLSYRTAVFGLLGGMIFVMLWLMATGLSFVYALLFLLTAVIVFIGLTRIIAQGGLAYGRASVTAPVFTVNAVGSTALGPAGLVALAMNYSWATDVRTFVMASAANGLKLADANRVKARRLIWPLLIAIVIALVGSMWMVLRLSYAYGGINLVGWHFIGLPQFAGNWVTRYLNNPASTHGWHLLFTGVGAALMVGLSFVKSRFLWWPLHPVGLALGLTHPIYHVWFSIFLAWMFKAFILKYGGPKLYRVLRPFFLGLILGGFASAGLWLIIDAFTGMHGNVFTLG